MRCDYILLMPAGQLFRLVACFAIFQRFAVHVPLFQISLIDKINRIYEATNFDKCGSGFGFEIREVNDGRIIFMNEQLYN